MSNFYKIITALNPENRFYLIVFTIFVVLRLAPILFIDVTPTSDASWYFQRAIDIAQGVGYKRGSEFTAFWPVGYPAFLAGVFNLTHPSVFAGQFANLLLACLSLFLIVKIAKHLTGEGSIAKLTALIFTFYPNNIAYTSILLTETLFTALLLLAAWLYIRKKDTYSGAISGIVFGLATLVKSQALVFPLAFAFISFVSASNRHAKIGVITKILALYIALGAVLLPWAVRNYMVFDEFVLVSTNGGISILAGNNPSMAPDFEKDFVMDDPLVESVGHPVKPELQVDKDAKQKAIHWIRSNPERFIALIPHKIWRLWAPDGEAEWAYQGGSGAYQTNAHYFRTARIINQGYYTLIILLALIFPIAYLRNHTLRENQWIWLSYLLALITTAISIAFSGQSRYHFPITPFLMVNASWVIYYFSKYRTKRYRT